MIEVQCVIAPPCGITAIRYGASGAGPCPAGVPGAIAGGIASRISPLITVVTASEMTNSRLLLPARWPNSKSTPGGAAPVDPRTTRLAAGVLLLAYFRAAGGYDAAHPDADDAVGFSS